MPEEFRTWASDITNRIIMAIENTIKNIEVNKDNLGWLGENIIKFNV